MHPAHHQARTFLNSQKIRMSFWIKLKLKRNFGFDPQCIPESENFQVLHRYIKPSWILLSDYLLYILFCYKIDMSKFLIIILESSYKGNLILLEDNVCNIVTSRFFNTHTGTNLIIFHTNFISRCCSSRPSPSWSLEISFLSQNYKSCVFIVE